MGSNPTPGTTFVPESRRWRARELGKQRAFGHRLGTGRLHVAVRQPAAPGAALRISNAAARGCAALPPSQSPRRLSGSLLHRLRRAVRDWSALAVSAPRESEQLLDSPSTPAVGPLTRPARPHRGMAVDLARSSTAGRVLQRRGVARGAVASAGVSLTTTGGTRANEIPTIESTGSTAMSAMPGA